MELFGSKYVIFNKLTHEGAVSVTRPANYIVAQIKEEFKWF